MKLRQLIIPVSWALPKKETEFVVNECNHYAFNWLEKWPFKIRDNFVCLVGEKGSGKTHLANIWATRQNAEFIDSSKEVFGRWYEISSNDFEQKYFVLDNADELNDDVLLFYIYNTIKEKNAYLLMTAKTYPNCWDINLKDVKSRLSTVSVIKIQKPNETAMNSIIEKMLFQRGISVKKAVIDYVANRIERSYESVNYWVNLIDRKLGEEKTKASLNAIKNIVK